MIYPCQHKENKFKRKTRLIYYSSKQALTFKIENNIFIKKKDKFIVSLSRYRVSWHINFKNDGEMMDEMDKYPMYIETAPELYSNPGPLSYKAPAITTLLYCFG